MIIYLKRLFQEHVYNSQERGKKRFKLSLLPVFILLGIFIFFYLSLAAPHPSNSVARARPTPTPVTPTPTPPPPDEDTIAPTAVSNLAASSPTDSTITLHWTSPGDDGISGTATSYDIRYSTSNITNGNWFSATQVSGEPTPLVAGTSQSMTVTGLSASTTYFFAIKTSDEVGNTSALSNIASLATTALSDTTPPTVPGIPQAVIGTNLVSQDWTWTASIDIGTGVSHYDWRIDGGPSGTATTPSITTNLTVGNWKFYVKAEDNAGNQSAENSSLLAVLSSSVHQIVVDCSVPLVQVITPDNVSDPVIDLSPVTAPAGGLLVANLNCGMHLETLLPSTTVTVDIPAGTAIKAPADTWTKVIIPPVVISPPTDLLPVAPPGFSNQIALAIEIGHNVASLDITKGTRIFLGGQAGKKVGHISKNVFTEITSRCANDSQAVGDALSAGQDCKIENGSDLIIWTKHFSKFVTYDLVSSSTITPSTTPNASNGSTAPTNTPTATPSISNNSVASTITPSTTPNANNSPTTNEKAQSEVTEPRLAVVLIIIAGIIIFIILLLKRRKKQQK